MAIVVQNNSRGIQTCKSRGVIAEIELEICLEFIVSPLRPSFIYDAVGERAVSA
jgi:hypothetical protein